MKKILVIDDEPAVQMMLAKMLERQGFAVLTASDGKEGMKVFRREMPDLVITDIIMPEKEGLELIMELKKEFPRVPCIAMSGGGKSLPDTYLKMARLMGACEILEKPIEKERLIQAVHSALL